MEKTIVELESQAMTEPCRCPRKAVKAHQAKTAAAKAEKEATAKTHQSGPRP